MTEQNSNTHDNFRRLLARNVRLPLGAGALSAAVFASLIFYLLNTLNWVEHTERVIGNAVEISKLSIDMETGMRGYLLTGDDSFLQPYELARPRFAGEVAVLTQLVSDNPPQVERLGSIGALQAQWNDFAKEIIAAKREGKDYQTAISSGRGKGVTDEIRRQLTSFITVEQGLLQERNVRAKTTTLWSVAGYLTFTLIVSILLAISGRRETRRLSKTYGDALRRQSEDAAALERLAWLRSGQTLLAEKVLTQSALAPMGCNTLEFLANYLHFPIAALYVQDESGHLQRIASFGFSQEHAAAQQTFYQSDGLVGQAASTNRILQLDNLPDDYVKVTSGLGQGKPQHVLVVPVHNDGQVNGVLELGFMRALTLRDLEFVKVIAGNIGTSIFAALARQRLHDALTRTQQLNEEMQVQQEELRTANEELEEQSRILKESQANLENQQAELEQTNLQLGEQAEALDLKNIALNAAQTQLELHAEELTRASRYKSEFLANMSHELRTPLNSSLILAKLLSDNTKGNLDEEQVKFSKSIYSAGNDLLSLINDILDISKVEAGKLELSPEHITIGKLAESLKNTFEPLANQKNLALEVSVEPDVPAAIFTDRQRVEQILKNLLSNAIKFTKIGKVSLRVSERAGHIAFAVRDSGIGIREDQNRSFLMPSARPTARPADGTAAPA